MTRGRFSNLELDDPKVAGKTAPGVRFLPQERDADACIRQALAHEAAGAPEAALRAYSAAVGEDPLVVLAWVGQVRMLMALKEYPEAGIWVDKALELFPQSGSLLAIKALVLHRLGHSQEARELNDTALGIPGQDLFVWLARGEILLSTDPSVAGHCFDQALRLAAGPMSKAAVQREIAAQYHSARRFGQALETLKISLMEEPQAAAGWDLLARTQMALGFIPEARKSIKEAIRLNPGNEDYRRTSLYWEKGMSLKDRVIGRMKRILGT